MSRKTIGARRRRGRPRLANAKRRQRTRIGRATGQDPIDNGSPLLVQRKLRATNRGDLELSGIGVLYGHREINGEQYEILTAVSLWVMRMGRAWGARDGSCEGLWRNILAAASRAGLPQSDNRHRQRPRRYRAAPAPPSSQPVERIV